MNPIFERALNCFYSHCTLHTSSILSILTSATLYSLLADEHQQQVKFFSLRFYFQPCQYMHIWLYLTANTIRVCISSYGKSRWRVRGGGAGARCGKSQDSEAEELVKGGMLCRSGWSIRPICTPPYRPPNMAGVKSFVHGPEKPYRSLSTACRPHLWPVC